ncbi:hypothetical protein G9A89_012220 [Geosiphon pyriformis]|nr:hypothetical protein G9A89_012220 [Geosiphon pyriformis]
MSAENFERSLAAILSAEEKKYQEVIFDRPTKRRKKIIVAGKENEFADLDLENSDTINNLIKEFNQISMEIGYTEPVLHKVFLLLVQHPNSWPRIIFIFSILKRLILQNPMPATLIIETDVQDLSQATVQQRPQVTISQILRFFPNLFIIDCPPLWMGTINFLFILMREHESDFVQVNPDLIINLVKQILRMANSLPKQLSTIEFDCIEKSLDLIDAFLIGRCCSGVSIISHYQIIEQLPAIYDNQKLVNGRYQNVHWTMEQLIDGLCRRRQNLAYLMMPPGKYESMTLYPSRPLPSSSLPKNRPFECEYEQLVRQGQATNLTSNFRDMFFQHAPVEEVKQMIENLKSINDRLPLAEAKSITDLLKPLHKAIVSRVKDVVLFTQQHSNFEPRKDYQMLSHEDMVIPENLDFWELVIEMADQLYSLVASDFIKYEDLLIDFVRLLQPGDDEDDDNDDSHPILQKDNTLIWLLLQLWLSIACVPLDIDAIGAKVIVPDLQNDERLFTMFVGLYNENQIKSKDAFYLRDLSLPCALSLQQPALQDRGNLKYRHPQLASALHYTPVCHQLLINYPKTYKDKVTNHDLFRNLPLEEIIKLSVLSQAQKVTVADTLYVYLISDKLIEIGKLAFPDAKFLKGGNVGYKLLDFLNIFGKNRFGQLIHKMVHDGDSWSKSHSDTGKNLNCVSPYIIDVVYKIIYGAPWSLQLMISEIFDKLRKVDNSLKQRAENGSALQEHTTRWHHTILELLNYRLLRFLKFSPRASNMLNFVKNSLSYVRHRQIYRGVEMFAIHSMVNIYFRFIDISMKHQFIPTLKILQTLQIDVKFIKTLADPNRDKSFWFGESEMLSRIMILTISRGFSDISLDLIQGVLESLYPKPLQWSRDTLEYFPEPMQVYLASQQVETGPEFDVPKVLFANVDSCELLEVFELIKQGSLSGILEKLLKGQAFEKSEEDLLIEHYSQLENQPIFLCIIWTFCILNKKVNSSLMNPLRKVLLQFSPSRMSTYTIVMVDFVIDQDYGSTDIDIVSKIVVD